MLTRMMLAAAALFWASATTSIYGLVGGQASTGFPAVFLWTGEAYELATEYCTATKIGSRHFLTAAHCLLQSSYPNKNNTLADWDIDPTLLPGSHVQISFHRTYLGQKPERLKIKKVHFHPLLASCLQGAKSKYCKSSRTPLPDLAIVELEEKRASAFYHAPWMLVNSATLADHHEIIMVGYGKQGNDDEQPPTLKTGFNNVTPFHWMAHYLRGTNADTDGLPHSKSFFASLGPLANPHLPNLGSGDSGGPVISPRDGRIVGVNSDGYCPLDFQECQVTNNSFMVRLDDWALGAPARWIWSVVHN